VVSKIKNNAMIDFGNDRYDEKEYANGILPIHFAVGYRSVSGSCIIKSRLNGISQVYHLSEAVKHFQK
jgi:hypothetical protein